MFYMDAIPMSDMKSDISFDISIKPTTWSQGSMHIPKSYPMKNSPWLPLSTLTHIFRV